MAAGTVFIHGHNELDTEDQRQLAMGLAFGSLQTSVDQLAGTI